MRVPLSIAGAMALTGVFGCALCIAVSIAAISVLSTLSPEEIVYGRELARLHPSPGRVGELQSSAGVELTVLKVASGERRAAGSVGAAGYSTYLVDLQVSVKNAGLDSLSFERSELGVSDLDGKLWRPLPAAPEQSLPTGTLARGEAAAGWLRYELPNESRGLRLHFEPADAPPGYRGIRVDLGR